MNNKTSLLLIVLAAIVVSCQKPLEISDISLSQGDLLLCKEATCPDIKVDYIKLSGDPEVSKTINDTIRQFIVQTLNIDQELPRKPKSIKDAMEGFIEIYRIHSAEFPDMSAAYFAEISVTDYFRNDAILSLECSNYLYTGGAHGYGTVQFKNFDPKTGELLQLQDIFKDVSAFEKLAEEKFKQQHNIAPSESINATGFWFEDDVFSLPASIGLSEKGAVLHYNAYDIAPYASGPIEVEISMNKLSSLLKIPME